MQSMMFTGRLAADPQISEDYGKAVFRLIEKRGVDGAGKDRLVGVNCVSWSKGLNEKVIARGLAERTGRRYRLVEDVEPRLRALQTRRDVIRTLNQRRLDGARDVRVLDRKVRGQIVRSGFHDEVGVAPYAVVRDADGVEHYSRLRAGSPKLEVGKTVVLIPLPNGLGQVMSGRDLAR